MPTNHSAKVPPIVAVPPPQVEVDASPSSPPARTTEIIIEIPEMLDLPVLGYVPSTFDVQLAGVDNHGLRNFIKTLAMTLESREAVLKNGRPVRGNGPAIVWLLERVAEASSG